VAQEHAPEEGHLVAQVVQADLLTRHFQLALPAVMLLEVREALDLLLIQVEALLTLADNLDMLLEVMVVDLEDLLPRSPAVAVGVDMPAAGVQQVVVQRWARAEVVVVMDTLILQ